MIKILITGINGFIGQNLITYLIHQQLGDQQKFNNLQIIGTYKDELKLNLTKGVGKPMSLNQLQQQTKYSKNCSLDFIQLDLTKKNLSEKFDLIVSKFNAIDCIIHCAGLAHRDLSSSQNSNIYDNINSKATKNLAKLAIKYKIKQFIFLSTSKVYGDVMADKNQPFFSIKSKTNPTDAYAKSKLKAEKIIQSMFETDGIKSRYTILRLPLIYGSGVIGNFEKLSKIITKLPILPTGSLDTKRTMLGVFNLADLISHLINHPKANNQIFIPTDRELFTLNQLIDKIAKLQAKKIYQIKVPKLLIICLLKLLGKNKIINQIIDDYVIQSHYGNLKWQPIYSFEQNFSLPIKTIKIKKLNH